MTQKIGREDLAITIGVLIFSIIIAKQALNYPEIARQVPFVIAIATALLSGFRLIRWFLQGKSTTPNKVEEDRKQPAEDIDKKGFIVAITSVIFYPLAVFLLGIVLGTFVFTILYMYLFGMRSIKTLTVSSSVLTLIIYLVFIKLLNVHFPPGIFNI